MVLYVVPGCKAADLTRAEFSRRCEAPAGMSVKASADWRSWLRQME